LEIVVSNAIAGDPLPGVGKRLRIEYEFDDQRYKRTIPESGRVDIP
jgi:hypothetical protein